MTCDTLITLRARMFGKSARAASATAVMMRFMPPPLLLLLLLLLPSIKSPQSLVSTAVGSAPPHILPPNSSFSCICRLRT
jgi:hypothetical protein